MLVSAFVRALRDPFVHARNAGLMALSATSEFYEPEDCANKIIPSISPLLIDKEKSPISIYETDDRIVRVQATKTIETFLARIAKLTVSMADTALPVPAETPRSLTPSVQAETFAASAGSAALWAMSGLTKKVLGSEISSSTNGTSGMVVNRPDSAPPTQTKFAIHSIEPELKGLGTKGDVDAWKDEVFDDEDWKPSRQRQKSAPATEGRGMKLGGMKKEKSIIDKVVEEEEQRKSLEEAGNAWGLDDNWDDEGNGEDGWGFDD